MLRYEILNRDTIEIDLENDYKVIALANWNNESKKYYVTLMLREKSIDNWSLIEKAENIELRSNVKTIKKNMAQLVTDLFNKGAFTYYIERYEYELKCFDRGNELFEQERLKKNGV